MCSKCPPAERTLTCFESHTPLVNGCVDDVLFNAAPNAQQTLSQIVNISIILLLPRRAADAEVIASHWADIRE